jgi:putative transposase
MAGKKIFNLPGHRHFVTFTTYKRRRFLMPERTRDIVVEVLQKSLSTHQTLCSGFVVMPNHVHAILFGDETFIVSRFVQVWKKTTSYRIKQFYERELTEYLDACPNDGPIWQPGFYDFNVESDEKNNEKLDYMHHNPVVDQLAPISVSWLWSSARYYELGEAVGVTLTP